jgi:signal recognition particle GTPase
MAVSCARRQWLCLGGHRRLPRWLAPRQAPSSNLSVGCPAAKPHPCSRRISKGFRSVKHRFQGKRELTPENIEEALRDIRVSLLEADVDFKVVRQFVAAVKEKAVGEVVRIEAKTGTGEKIKVNPGDHFIHLCHEELRA